ncbi:MAG: 4a-hydroxytetrahydrobiopterin dehydratase [Phycisphaerales bacterium]
MGIYGGGCTVDKLDQTHIDERLAKRPDWSQVGDSISRTYQFDDFGSAMGFVNKVADAAEAMQHHPDILIRYNKVTLTLSTHDANGITDKDFSLAGKSDEIASTF